MLIPLSTLKFLRDADNDDDDNHNSGTDELKRSNLWSFCNNTHLFVTGGTSPCRISPKVPRSRRIKKTMYQAQHSGGTPEIYRRGIIYLCMISLHNLSYFWFTSSYHLSHMRSLTSFIYYGQLVDLYNHEMKKNLLCHSFKLYVKVECL